MNPTIELLGRQHRTVLDRLDRVEATAPGCTAALEEFVAFLESEVAEHFGLEEEALFPVLARRPPLAAGPLAVMDAEHRQFRALLVDLGAALRSGAVGRSLPALRPIITLLREHIDKEDRVLFPLAEHVLTAAELAEVEARAAARSVRGRSAKAPP